MSGLGQVLSVGQLSLIVSETLSLIPAGLIVEGDVQKVRIYKDFMVFFELSGDGQSINAYATLADLRGEVPIEGSKVRVEGEVQTGKKTELRFKVRALETADGVSDSAKKLEEIKLKLRAEGAFEGSRKKSLPRIPKRVAVITAGTSSAWEDFKRVSSSRFLAAELVLFSTSVQGNLSVQEICSALAEILEREEEFDVIAVVRGGGSRGDLESFNSEEIARAALKFSIPLVSGVGHEDDVSLLDLVADVRASTPSNAAELIFPDYKSLLLEVKHLEGRLSLAMQGKFNTLASNLEDLRSRSRSGLESIMVNLENRLRLVAVKLNALDFEKIFAKGFALLEHKGSLVKSVKDVSAGDKLTAKLGDGGLRLIVESKGV